MSVIIALTDEQIAATYPVMRQLRPHLQPHAYVETIRRLQREYGYTLAYVMDDGNVRAATGYRFSENLAWGSYMYVDDLITDEAGRSHGFAARLFDWLEAEAARRGCAALHLDSGVHRHDAHRFYLKRRMNISSHHFDKKYGGGG